MEIWSLVRGELRHKKSTFLGIFILSFVISICLSTIVSVNKNAVSEMNASLDYNRAGDVMAWVLEDHYDNEKIEVCRKNEHVKKIYDRQVLGSKNFIINKKKASSAVFFLKYGTVNTSPRVFNDQATGFLSKKITLKDNEVLLPYAMKELYHCKKGSTIKIDDAFGKEIKLRIAGFVEEPVCGSGFIGIKNIFLSDTIWNKLYDGKKQALEKGEKSNVYAAHFVSIILKKAYSQDKKEDIKKELDKESGLFSSARVILDKADSIRYTNMFTNIVSNVLIAFSISLFIVVMIVIAHGISTNISLEYTKYGVLKAQGYTNFQLRLLLIIQYIMGAVFGEILGVAGSIFLIMGYHKLLIGNVGIHAANHIAIVDSILLCLVTLVAIVLMIIVKTKKITKISPVRAISGGGSAVYFANRIHVDLVKKSKLPLSLRMAFKELLCDKKSYIGMCLLFALLTFFMLAAGSTSQLTSNDSLAQVLGTIDSDIDVKLKDCKEPEKLAMQIKEKTQQKASVKKSYYQYSKYVMLEDESFYCEMSDDMGIYKSVSEGRAPKYDNEIMITDIVRDLVHKDIGDKVSVRYQDVEKEYVISGIYSSMIDVGRAMCMSEKGFQRLDSSAKKEYFYMILDPDQKINKKKLAKELREEFAEYKEEGLEITAEGDGEIAIYFKMGISIVTLIIYIISLIFIAIVVFLVCGKLFYKERHNMGIYKAMGFREIQLRFSLTFRFCITALTGCLLGMGCSILFNNSVMSLLLRQMGITNFKTIYSVDSVLFSIAFIGVTAFVFTYFASRKIKKVSVKELITE